MGQPACMAYRFKTGLLRVLEMQLIPGWQTWMSPACSKGVIKVLQSSFKINWVDDDTESLPGWFKDDIIWVDLQRKLSYLIKFNYPIQRTMIQKSHICSQESLQGTAKSKPWLSCLQQGYLVLACGFGYVIPDIQTNSLGATWGMSVLPCAGLLALCPGRWVTQRRVESSLYVITSKSYIDATF